LFERCPLLVKKYFIKRIPSAFREIGSSDDPLNDSDIIFVENTPTLDRTISLSSDEEVAPDILVLRDHETNLFRRRSFKNVSYVDYNSPITNEDEVFTEDYGIPEPIRNANVDLVSPLDLSLPLREAAEDSKFADERANQSLPEDFIDNATSDLPEKPISSRIMKGKVSRFFKVQQFQRALDN
jgi:hypothetical protein